MSENITETKVAPGADSSPSSGSPLAEKRGLRWRIHTANLLSEIVNCSGESILLQPLRILGETLAEVGERAIELNDPKLNALMCRLTIYTCADPKSQDYDPELTKRVLDAENSDYPTAR